MLAMGLLKRASTNKGVHMISVEKNRIQIEVMEKMNDMKATRSPETSENKTNFLTKLLAPFDLRKKENEKLKVLLCEDDKLWTMIIKKYLENEGVEVTTSISPVHYLSRKALASFDLIITDNQMPYMYGTQFVDYVEKELALDIPMYICSADSSLKEDVSLTKVLKGIFYKGCGLELTVKTILDDFKKYQDNLQEKAELKFAMTANTLIA